MSEYFLLMSWMKIQDVTKNTYILW